MESGGGEEEEKEERPLPPRQGEAAFDEEEKEGGGDGDGGRIQKRDQEKAAGEGVCEDGAEEGYRARRRLGRVALPLAVHRKGGGNGEDGEKCGEEGEGLVGQRGQGDGGDGGEANAEEGARLTPAGKADVAFRAQETRPCRRLQRKSRWSGRRTR